MTVLAQAAQTTAANPLTLVLGAAMFAAGYAFACWFWPWTACRKCDGQGRFRSPSGKNWRNCPRCEGKGRKQRLGVEVLRRLGWSKR